MTKNYTVAEMRDALRRANKTGEHVPAELLEQARQVLKENHVVADGAPKQE